MAITITSREFNQNASKVLKMAEKEPVFITKWGKIVSVVSNYVDYQQKKQTKPQTLADAFASSVIEDDDVVDMEDFEQILRDIRKNSKCRTVEFD